MVFGLVGLALALIGLVFSLQMMARNERVFRLRRDSLDALYRAARLDHLAGVDDYQWRLEAYEAVSYHRMLWQFWRPVESFYSDRRFIQPRSDMREKAEMTNPLEPKPGFDWTKVRWTGPWAPVDETCSYCGAAIPEEDVPLRMWNTDSWAAVFCEACMAEWWGMQTIPDEDEAFD